MYGLYKDLIENKKQNNIDLSINRVRLKMFRFLRFFLIPKSMNYQEAFRKNSAF